MEEIADCTVHKGYSLAAVAELPAGFNAIENEVAPGWFNEDSKYEPILLQQNYQRLPKIAEFISLNLPFVSQISIMGLEITGYAEKRFQEVWIDPMFCTTELARAVASLEQSRIQVRLFNLPLCLLPQQLWEYACRSISDWEQTYLAACEKCKVKEKCCGLFSTSKWYSCFIRPVL